MSDPAARRRDRLVAQAEAALARLAQDPRDHVARGSLHEAVERLDRHLGTEDPGDRQLRERLVEDVRRRHLSPPLPPLPVRTERLLLRLREPHDIDDLHAIYGRDDVTELLLQPALARDELELWLSERAASDEEDAVGLLAEHDGRVVGEVSLAFHGPTQAELGWTFHPDVGGRGLATEAARALLDLGFGHYALHRITAELDARNTASRRLCERLGMRLEGHRLADYWSKGEWTDTLQYALLAGEWDARRH